MSGTLNLALTFKAPATAGLLLDIYPAVAAYSDRQLVTAFAGSPTQVRRSVDNTEKIIAFNAGAMDETSLKNFNAENLATYSEDFNSWTKTAGSVSTDATVDPLGGSTADQLTHGSQVNINQAPTTTANVKYVFSCYLKKSGSVNNCDLYMYQVGVGFAAQATFNLNTGSIVSETYGSGATIESIGSGWYRCSVNATHSGTTTSFGVYNTTEVYAWGGQFQSVYYGDYIATTTPHITRGNLFRKTWYDQYGNYDLAQVTTSNQPRIMAGSTIDTAGTRPAMYFDGSAYKMSVSGISVSQPNTILIVTKNLSGTNRNALDGATARQAIYVNGSDYISFYAGSTQNSTTAYGSTNHIIMANFDGAGSTVYNNGSLILSANPGANGLTDISLGTFSGSYWLGYIQEVIIWNSNQAANATAIYNDVSAYYV